VGKYLAALAAKGAADRKGEALKFRVDTEMDNKLLISVAPGGYLQRL
jgi:cephalosporin hydroxylase